MLQIINDFKQIFSNRKQYKTPIRFLNSTLFSTAVSFALGFVTFRFIAPDHLGIWGTFSTFTVYATFLRLGIPNGMNRELPYYYGKGDDEMAMKCASTTLFHALFVTLVSFVVAISFFFLFDFSKYNELSTDYRNTAIIFWIVVLLEPYTTYLSGTYRTSANFDKLSRLQVTKSLFGALTILLLVIWGFEGYLLRQLMLSMYDTIYLHVFRPIRKIKISFDWEVFKKLFTVGFQLFITSYLVSFIDTLPRLYIINNGTSLDVGLFSPVIVLSGVIFLVPNTISQYLYPTFSYAYGKGYDRLYFWNKMKIVLLGSVLIGAVAVLVAYFSIDYVLQIFPKYLDSGACIKVACWGFAFIGYKVAGMLCSIFKEWKWLYISSASYAIIQIITLLVVPLFISNPLMVASVSMSLTATLMFGVAFFIAYKVTHQIKK